MHIVSRITAMTGAAVLAATFTAASASAASAAPHSHSVTAVTRMTNRPDSGAIGDWATDNFLRVATVTSLGTAASSHCGGSSPCYAYGASLTDGTYGGTFTTIPFALTPNQSGGYAGQRILGTITGGMHGTGGFAAFWSTAKPDASLVPSRVNGSNDPSSSWPALFFPAGTTFGISEVTFDYNYGIVGFGRIVRSQHWEDSGTNGGGDEPQDGNITGI